MNDHTNLWTLSWIILKLFPFSFRNSTNRVQNAWQHRPLLFFAKAFHSILLKVLTIMNLSKRRGGIDNGGGGKHKSSCRPPRGKTYLTIGQDFFSIQEYLLSQYNASLHRPDGHHILGEVGNSFRTASSILPFTYFHPACTMTYTDIYQLKGLDQPADYGSGIEYVKGAWKQPCVNIGWCDHLVWSITSHAFAWTKNFRVAR